MTCASLVIPGRRANTGPEIQMQARSVFLDSGFALSARPGMTTYSIVKQHGRAASPVFFSAPGTPSSLSVPRKGEGDGAPGGATIVRSVPRSLSRDAGASWRAIAGVFLTAPGRALRVPSVSPAGLRVLPRSAWRAVGPRWPCSWRAARSGRRAELPAPPGCGRSVLSRPRAPHPVPPT